MRVTHAEPLLGFGRTRMETKQRRAHARAAIMARWARKAA
jgi:hypothetical protein